MPTKKDNNPIEKQSSFQKNILNNDKNDQLQQSTKKSNTAKSSHKNGETPDID